MRIGRLRYTKVNGNRHLRFTAAWVDEWLLNGSEDAQLASVAPLQNTSTTPTDSRNRKAAVSSGRAAGRR